jgi:hypothetical protein
MFTSVLNIPDLNDPLVMPDEAGICRPAVVRGSVPATVISSIGLGHQKNPAESPTIVECEATDRQLMPHAIPTTGRLCHEKK